MKVTRVYTGPDNRSHFEDVEIPLKDGGAAGRLSELMKATASFFGKLQGLITMTGTTPHGDSM